MEEPEPQGGALATGVWSAPRMEGRD